MSVSCEMFRSVALTGSTMSPEHLYLLQGLFLWCCPPQFVADLLAALGFCGSSPACPQLPLPPTLHSSCGDVLELTKKRGREGTLQEMERLQENMMLFITSDLIYLLENFSIMKSSQIQLISPGSVDFLQCKP